LRLSQNFSFWESSFVIVPQQYQATLRTIEPILKIGYFEDGSVIMMKNTALFLAVFLGMLSGMSAETLKGHFAGTIALDARRNEAAGMALLENQIALVEADGDLRFFRGLEFELTVPQHLIAAGYTVLFYAELKERVENEEWEARPLYTETVNGKHTAVFQIPFRPNAGLRRTPYITLLPELPGGETALPLMLRVVRAGEEGGQVFVTTRLIPGDEGAARIALRYPQLLRDRPVSVLIDDEVVNDLGALHILREGEHQLLVVSEDYRTESRRFLIERGKISDITVTLKDTTPVLLFEAPDRALIFINNRRIVNPDAPYPIAPGTYDIRIQVSDYTIIKTVQVLKGKTYRIAFTIDLSVSEDP
jgi:hypothetical protein